ncbi:zinc-dependent alcohol dehydrogenase family protein [Streptomyces sp. NPDC017248]|uniref:zinc-dependent alcohol dehydrogenase family protein n=1 Tax=unclassified Streptomyces TaxID=2593676 RepID=UPI0037AE361B
MRALVFQGYGDPARVLRLVRLPRPEPGPGQVRVRLAARPVNPSDLLFVQGAYGREAAFTVRTDAGAGGGGWAVAGFEGAGTVDALGPGTTGPAPGTRVAVSATGTWQEHVCVPADAVVPVADGLPTEAACQFTVNPFTAVLLVREVALGPGDLLLLTAGGSAVSRMMIHLARERGIRCLPVVRRPGQARELARSGAEPVLTGSAGALAAAVADVAGRQRVDAVLDAVGGDLGGAALRCLRPGGRFVSYGMLSGDPLPVSPDDLVFHQVRVRGFWLPTSVDRLDEQALGRLTREVGDALARGLPGLDVAARHDLADFPAAVENARRSGRDGKVVLTG